MDITWQGNTCFVCKGKDSTVVINPDLQAGKVRGQIVLSSLKKEDTVDVEYMTQLCDWPGEYEVGGVPIVAFQAWKTSKKSEEEGGKKADSTLIFRFDLDGIKICHLGELGHSLTSDMVKEIGDTDILMMNAGKGTNLESKKAVEILEAIDPRMLIIGTGEGKKELMKELGADQVEEMESFSFKSRNDLPESKRGYIVLSKTE
ncbi:MAG: MBL fold metallo-hydrolase [Candidatus Gracilibacteria bacterium]|nr:MBL fold metallo-hydrolase [Candidatus Gracilibacteria bacterium]